MKKPIAVLLLSFFIAIATYCQTDSVMTPVSFISLQIKSFDARVVDKSIQLLWDVTTNEDARSFEVERSENGADFRKIGGRLAQAHTGLAAYEFVDALPKKNVSFSYRIRFNSKDGYTNYSTTQVLRVGEESLQCRLRRNPVAQTIELEVVSPVALQATAVVLSAYGQKVSSESVKLIAGANSLSFSAQQLQPGLHRLVLEAGSERKVLSFVKE